MPTYHLKEANRAAVAASYVQRLIQERADYDRIVLAFRKEHPYIQPTEGNLIRFVNNKEPIAIDAGGKEIEGSGVKF